MQHNPNKTQTTGTHSWWLLSISFALTLAILSSGCALFAPEEPQQPRTVQEWIDQPRVN